MDFSFDFARKFAPDYQIASGKASSVRCFPSCAENGHHDGFCGSAVFATIRMR